MQSVRSTQDGRQEKASGWKEDEESQVDLLDTMKILPFQAAYNLKELFYSIKSGLGFFPLIQYYVTAFTLIFSFALCHPCNCERKFQNP